MVTAHLGASAVHRSGPAGAGAGRLVQHGQMGGGGVGGGSLGGRAPRLPHDGCVGVPVQQLGEVGLLENLTAVVDHPTAAGQGGGRRGGGGEGRQGETQKGGEGQGEGGGAVGVVGEDGGVGGAGSGTGS